MLPAIAKEPAFPVHISDNRRYLMDVADTPFLMTGEAAWSLIADLSREDAEDYLEDRRRRGFNTLLISLIESRFSRNAPRNFYGDAPFRDGKDFLEPNDAYFRHADWVLHRAREKGFLVLLAPAYLGVSGGQEGWYRAMKAAGSEALRSYGEYVGRRYGAASNIIWINGGDYNPPDRSVVQAVAEGISAVAPNALHSVHGSPDTIARDFWRDAGWLDLDSLYSYGDIARDALARYKMQPAMPFFLIESRYEGEGANEMDIRRIAYSALLSGACGQIFGNSSIWHFDGPGLYSSDKSWREALSSRGTESIGHLRKLFESLPWWKLEPDLDGLLSRHGEAPRDNIAGARAKDGSFALIYLWNADGVSLESKAIRQGSRTEWYDPSSGEYIFAAGKADASGAVRFHVPSARNSSGFSDWVLLVRN